MNADDVNRLHQLEQENARLKRLLAERDLEIEVMREGEQKIRFLLSSFKHGMTTMNKPTSTKFGIGNHRRKLGNQSPARHHESSLTAKEQFLYKFEITSKNRGTN